MDDEYSNLVGHCCLTFFSLLTFTAPLTFHAYLCVYDCVCERLGIRVIS